MESRKGDVEVITVSEHDFIFTNVPDRVSGPNMIKGYRLIIMDKSVHKLNFEKSYKFCERQYFVKFK
jgi:hypothetical protein